MSDSGSLRSTTARDATAREAVVRPLARAAQRACVRPGCPSPARATLSFRYDSREAWLERLGEEPRPESYDLCAAHAVRTQAPHGWQLRDRRPREEQVADEPPPAPDDLGGEQTVAVLAAALRSVPEPAAPEPTPEPDTAPEPEAEAEPLEDVSSPVLEQLRPPPGDGVPSGPQPRPVPAARQRRAAAERDRTPDGPASDW